eukprot:CAMPEP_0194481754 /NCGR_PEP_ID=MMETSP0253-20130528/4030_1 /TAXON_ID=2966 /ORGANISM="Noctiluca scintillans" /LENGTH=294 /DNA_ID=CAMNT_0039321257 /DNA_START=46 /DNA_END=930 /DNA_ORIENTATION=+
MTDARSLKRDAERKVKGGFLSCLAGNARFEEACELYTQAAIQFKLSSEWQEVADCYMQCAFCATKCGNMSDEGDFHLEAGHALKRISTAQALEEYEMAITVFNNGGKFSQSGKLLMSMADLLEAERATSEAMNCYERASDLFAMEERSVSDLTKCRLKLAEHCSESDVKKAIAIFEDEGEKSLRSNLLRFGAKDFFFKAGILHLVMGDPVTVSMAVEKYQQLDPSFSGSREGALLADLALAFEAGDQDTFVDKLTEYDSVRKLEAWHTMQLLQVKEAMTSSSGGKGILDTLDLT